ncbi:hypothetical protein C8R47DRAFT_1000400 [Mycena vitilis]|nr:hypothetical protein C8R47DRAFT_1000400 [Mycena vitilis]
MSAGSAPAMSPETLKITSVCIDPDIQGSIICKFSVNGADFTPIVLQNKVCRQPLPSTVVARRGTSVLIDCTHKQGWQKPVITLQKMSFSDIVQQTLCPSPKNFTTLPDGSEITLRIDPGDPPHLKYTFRLKPVELGPVVHISMAKVNQGIAGSGIDYIGLRADGATAFEKRLTRAPYPQEFPLMFSFHPEMDLRLCLLRRPFYWPIKRSVMKSSPLTASEAHNLLAAGPSEGVEHTFEDTPITVRLQLKSPRSILQQTAKIIDRRTHLLDRLGRSRGLLENAAKLISSASEMHPIAKTIATGLGQIYNNLVEIKDWDAKLLDLIEDMTDFLQYVEAVKPFATVQNFQHALETLTPMIQRVGNLVSKYPHGLSFQDEMSEYEDLRRRFQRWTSQFQNCVAVENLKHVGTIHEMMAAQTDFFERYRKDIVDHIRPPGTDRRRPIPACLAGTRERIFRKIDAWLADRTSPNILWIKGFPGSGKSCIARSVVDRLEGSPCLNSSFFFERDVGGFTEPSTMLRTISSDLCQNRVFLEALLRNLDRRINFSTTSIQDQFFQLVGRPLQNIMDNLDDGQAVVVVVDALDECGGLSRSRDRQEVLSVVKRWSAFSPSLRLVVTSRDETPISNVLTPVSTPLDLRLSSSEARRDIEAFLDLELKQIGAAHCLPDWPTPDQIRRLALKAKGLFVWAATLVKFVDQPRPQDILDMILRGDTNVEGDITELYRAILDFSFCAGGQKPNTRFLEEFRLFIGAIVTARQPWEIMSPLFSILGISASTASYISGQLRSVMVPDKAYLRFNHQSFVDFLLSETCPRKFRIVPTLIMQAISLSLLHLLNDRLRFDPSEFPSSHRSNSTSQMCISPELVFACQFWGDTLPFGEQDGHTAVSVALKTFLETKFLFWLEALSLAGQMPSALSQLYVAKEALAAFEADAALSTFVADAIVFVETFQDCIGKSAPHLYLSAMAFTPVSSRIYQTYSAFLNKSPPCVSVAVQSAHDLRKGRSAIPATITYVPSGEEVAQAFEGHVDEIMSAIFIQNDYVSSGSQDKTIRFWDPSSNAPALDPFVDHTKAVTSLAFSKAQMLLASGSRDGGASVWDMRSHELLTSFTHEAPVTCVALSPTGKVLMTGCRDGVVKFWNIRRREESRPACREQTKRVTGVVFLDDQVAISGSMDKSIYVHYLSGQSKLIILADKRVRSLAISTTSRVLVAACDRCITIWDLSHNNIPGDPSCLVKHSDEMESVAVHGNRIAAAVGNRIEIWDAVSRECVLTLTGHRDVVTTLSFSDDGRHLVSGSGYQDRSVRVWNVDSGAGRTFRGFHDGSRIEPAGWIRGPEPKRDLLIWVPEYHRRRLCWGRTVAVMDGKPATYLTVCEDLLGRRWYKIRRVE